MQNWRTMQMNLLGHPNLLMIFQIPSRLTVSNALVKCGVEVNVLFLALLLVAGKYHAYCSSFFPEVTPALGEQVLL